jgi:hypothetical protein
MPHVGPKETILHMTEVDQNKIWAKREFNCVLNFHFKISAVDQKVMKLYIYQVLYISERDILYKTRDQYYNMG